MAHHNSTPKSVLNAPRRTAKYVSPQDNDNNRYERRHFVDPNGARHFVARGPLAMLAAPAGNVPHVLDRSKNHALTRQVRRQLVRARRVLAAAENRRDGLLERTAGDELARIITLDQHLQRRPR